MKEYDVRAIQAYAAERGDFWLREYLTPFAAFRTNTEFFLDLDYRLQHMALTMRTIAAKGETTEETQTVRKDVKTKVFATWFDHLKYDLREGRIGGLPALAKKRLTVRYQEISTPFAIEVPVKITKFCPHIEVDWKRDPRAHITYLHGGTYGQ